MTDTIDLDINLASTPEVGAVQKYHYDLILKEYNGQCRIDYWTNSPLHATGVILLFSAKDPSTAVAEAPANVAGGSFQTNKPWGIGWFAQWVSQNTYNEWVTLVKTPTTI